MKIESINRMIPTSDAASVKIGSKSPPAYDYKPLKIKDSEAAQTVESERSISEEFSSQDFFAYELEEDVSELNTRLESMNYAIRFKVDSETDDVIVTVVDRETDEVIREIPPEEVIKMRVRFKEMAGLLLEETV